MALAEEVLSQRVRLRIKSISDPKRTQTITQSIQTASSTVELPTSSLYYFSSACAAIAAEVIFHLSSVFPDRRGQYIFAIIWPLKSTS
jgi:hypothetical protein